MKLKYFILILINLTSIVANAQSERWKLKKAPLMTQWAAKVNPENPLPEYPRPQMVRKEWLNLNGLWQFQPGKQGEVAPVGKALPETILVPFAVESAISGIMEHYDRLWYRRTFKVPTKWKNWQLVLHFGAVDFESEVFINGKSVGVHKGGYDRFSYDITKFLKNNGEQELIVRVFDPTKAEGQPRGKQTTTPGGVMYTPTTGIWQTVWLEPVSINSIKDFKIVPDIDASKIKLTVNASATSGLQLKAIVKEGSKVIKQSTSPLNKEWTIDIPNPKLWSPGSPFLYDIELKLLKNGEVTDKVESYFGMRKISIVEESGVKKLYLNNKFLYQTGILDQGFWPDGIYTPPTEEALKFDIQQVKNMGFNMIRKHIKVEPDRWYYWTDKLGLLVWQDMPSANSYMEKNDVVPPVDTLQYEVELKEMVKEQINHPSIIMWVIFNEGQGQFGTEKLVNLVRRLDPSRLVSGGSGGKIKEFGDVYDSHHYPEPVCPPNEGKALVCGEFGGIGYAYSGHTWTGKSSGYTNINSSEDLLELYTRYSKMLKSFRDEKGMSASVYTQVTDVMTENNGLLTYDRLLKCDPKEIAKANSFDFTKKEYKAVLPTADEATQTWKYTTTAPEASWTQTNFNDKGWIEGLSGFGKAAQTIGKTSWNTPAIWMRKTFNPGKLGPEELEKLVLKNFHDEDIEVYINGILAYKASGYSTSYQFKGITKDAKDSIKANADNLIAVYCKQKEGGQFVDVGIYIAK